jgi:RNA polymerase sigma factor (sigma-70 family)
LASDPDGELVARVGAGDRAAARLLVARHVDKLLALARRMLGDGAEAEDAVQDTFLKLWTHAARWQPGGAKFETWLFRVAINACYDRLRKRGLSRSTRRRRRSDPHPAPNARSKRRAFAIDPGGARCAAAAPAGRDPALSL